MTEELGEDVQGERGCQGPQGNGDLADAWRGATALQMANLGALLAGAEAGPDSKP